MIPLDEFMDAVRASDPDIIRKCMIPSEKGHGHFDRVEAMENYLKELDYVDCNKYVHTDKNIAVKYINKANSCKNRNIDFMLSFSEYKRLMSRKTCYYTGISMTCNDSRLPTHKTIDRVDSSKGYSIDNCVTCTSYANSLKNTILEQQSQIMNLTIKQFKLMASRL